MNIKLLNTYLKQLPRPAKGFMWKMVKEGECIKEGMFTAPGMESATKTVLVGHPRGCGGGDGEFWYLVPRPVQKWRKSPLDIFNEQLSHYDLGVEAGDAIISEFIREISTEKDFRAWLNKKTKLIESYAD